MSSFSIYHSRSPLIFSLKKGIACSSLLLISFAHDFGNETSRRVYGSGSKCNKEEGESFTASSFHHF